MAPRTPTVRSESCSSSSNNTTTSTFIFSPTRHFPGHCTYCGANSNILLGSVHRSVIKRNKYNTNLRRDVSLPLQEEIFQYLVGSLILTRTGRKSPILWNDHACRIQSLYVNVEPKHEGTVTSLATISQKELLQPLPPQIVTR